MSDIYGEDRYCYHGWYTHRDDFIDLKVWGKSLLRSQPRPFALDTKDIMPKSVVDIVQFIETIGQLQYDSYVADRLEKHTMETTFGYLEPL